MKVHYSKVCNIANRNLEKLPRLGNLTTEMLLFIIIINFLKDFQEYLVVLFKMENMGGKCPATHALNISKLFNYEIVNIFIKNVQLLADEW